MARSPQGELPRPIGCARVDAPVDGIWASDHFGVVVDVEIEKQER